MVYKLLHFIYLTFIIILDCKYSNFAIFKRKEPATFGDITYTHFMSCAPKKEERKEGVRYIIADLSETVDSNKYPSSTEVEAAPSVSQDDDLDLPF